MVGLTEFVWRIVTTLPQISAAYAAGYFDAEGCVRAFRNNGRTWTLRVSFGQTDPAVIKRLAHQFGGTLHRYTKKNGDKPVTHWVIVKRTEVDHFLRTVAPHVREKHDEVEAALNESLDEALAQKLSALKKRSLNKTTLPVGLLTTPRARHTCSEPDCLSEICARGLCNMHYLRARTNGVFKTTPRGTARYFEYGRKPALEERQYIAGFFDGDGCLSFVQQNNHWMIVFGQCRPEGILLLNEIYGGTTWLRAAYSQRRPALRWTLNARNALQAFLRDVEPFCVEKRAQITRVIRC